MLDFTFNIWYNACVAEKPRTKGTDKRKDRKEMKETKMNTFKKAAVGLTALLMALSVASCGSSAAEDTDKAEKEETTTTAAAKEEASEEKDAGEEKEEKETEAPESKNEETEKEKETEAPESKPEETAETIKPEKEEGSAAETTISFSTDIDELNSQVESMIASIEAEIPVITSFTGLDLDNNNKPEAEGATTTTTTTPAVSEDKPETTGTPVVGDSSTLKSEQQLIFEGKTYDNTTFVSEGISLPSGWTVGGYDKQYENSAYPNSYIVLGQSKGASFVIADAKSKGETTLPSLTLYKGLTWGATAAEIKAAYGTPIKEGNSEHYGSSMTNLWYRSSDGSLMVFEVSADWGLVVVDCFGK